ncbi:MAG: GNAT family N-acetyltransferase [Clostridiales bacterium]|nr:GNAT family N-acetyltransferase [Clostridiales bacterium]
MLNRLLRRVAIESGEFLSERAYFSALPRLETPDLILRTALRKDAEDVFCYAADPEVARYVLWDPHTSVGESRAYIRYLRRLYREGMPSSWMLELKSTGRVIGSMGFVWYSSLNRSAELGYSLARPCWNHGLATQALSAVVRSAFDNLPVHRLEAQHDLRNPASGRVLEKCGFTREGVLRGRVFNKGEMVDTVLWSLLRSDLPRV